MAEPERAPYEPAHGWLPRLPAPPVSLADFDRMDEDNRYRYEISDGALIVSPRPAKPDQRVAKNLTLQLDPQVPAGFELLPEVDVILAEDPLHIRIPDLVIVKDSDDPDGARCSAADVVVAIEVISPGSKHDDRHAKPVAYEEAGVPHYWVIDPSEPISLATYHLAGEFGYQESPAMTGRVDLGEPFPVRLDLPRLLVRR